MADEGRNNTCVSHWCCGVEVLEEKEEEEDDDDDYTDSDYLYHSTHDSRTTECFEEQEEGGKENKDERNGSRYVDKVEAVIEQSERSISTTASQQRDAIKLDDTKRNGKGDGNWHGRIELVNIN